MNKEVAKRNVFHRQQIIYPYHPHDDQKRNSEEDKNEESGVVHLNGSENAVVNVGKKRKIGVPGPLKRSVIRTAPVEDDPTVYEVIVPFKSVEDDVEIKNKENLFIRSKRPFHPVVFQGKIKNGARKRNQSHPNHGLSFHVNVTNHSNDKEENTKNEEIYYFLDGPIKPSVSTTNQRTSTHLGDKGNKTEFSTSLKRHTNTKTPEYKAAVNKMKQQTRVVKPMDYIHDMQNMVFNDSSKN